jgi:hypothetical protein
MRVTSPSTCYENFKVDLLSKIVYNVISSTYIIKEIETLVSCVYSVIMHSGNVERTLEKRAVKYSAKGLYHGRRLLCAHAWTGLYPTFNISVNNIKYLTSDPF